MHCAHVFYVDFVIGRSRTTLLAYVNLQEKVFDAKIIEECITLLRRSLYAYE